jgi:hypothetical protein
MQIFAILLIPLALSGIAVLPGKTRSFGVFNAAGHFINAVLAVWLSLDLLRTREAAAYLGFF